MFIKITLLVLFFLVMIFVGVVSRHHATNVKDFVLGGRSVGPWLTAFAYGTSYFSAVVFIGYAGQFGYKYGLSTTWIGLGNALIGSLLAWLVLGNRTRIMTKHLHAKTMPDFFGKRFNSSSIKIVASVIVFVFMIPYTASVYNGLSRLFEMAFDIPFIVCVIAMAALTGVYVILGGYMATAINDFIQGMIMLVGIVAVIISVLNGQGGFTESIHKMASIGTGEYASIFGPEPLSLLAVVILTSLGTWGLPQMVHKFYAIKDRKAVRTGTIISTIFAIIISGGCYFLGGFGRLFDISSLTSQVNGTTKIAYDGIVPLMLQNSLSDLLIGVVVVLVLSASMSTLSSLVMTSSSTITIDLIKGTFVKDMKDKKQLLIMRLLIVFFIAISVIMAINPPMLIAQLMGVSWGALAGAFLAPFLYGLYWKGVTKAAVWASFIVGVGITLVNMFVGFLPSSIEAGALAMLAGMIVVPIVSLLTRKLPKEETDELFTCYQEKE